MRHLNRCMALALVSFGAWISSPCSAVETTIVCPPTLPGGAVDPDGKTGYVTNSKGNIEAIDLKTGKSLWVSSDAYRPIAVAGDKLIAQSRGKDKPNGIRLALLDLRAEGKLLKQSEELAVSIPNELDQTSSAGGGGGGSSSFGIYAAVEKGSAVVWWTGYTSRYVNRGVAPRPGEARSWVGWHRGSWRLDLETGEAKRLGGGSLQSRSSFEPNLAEIESEIATAAVAPESVEKQKGKEAIVLVKPWAIDGRGHMLVGNKISAKRHDHLEYQLMRWDTATGKAADPIKLHEGIGFPLEDSVAAGGRTIVLRTAEVDPETGRPNDKFHLLLFSSETGKRLADLVLAAPAEAQLMPDRSTISISTEKSVILIDGATGKQLADIASKKPQLIQSTPDARTLLISDSSRLVIVTAASGKRVAEVELKKSTAPPRLISDGNTVLLSNPANDNGAQRVTLLSTATGIELGQIEIACGKELQLDQVVGVIGTRVFTVATAIEAGQEYNATTLSAFDAAKGELAWKVSYNSRRFQAPPYRGPLPPSRPPGPPK